MEDRQKFSLVEAKAKITEMSNGQVTDPNKYLVLHFFEKEEENYYQKNDDESIQNHFIKKTLEPGRNPTRN